MLRSVREVELVGRRWEQAGGKGRGRCTLATIYAGPQCSAATLWAGISREADERTLREKNWEHA